MNATIVVSRAQWRNVYDRWPAVVEIGGVLFSSYRPKDKADAERINSGLDYPAHVRQSILTAPDEAHLHAPTKEEP